MASQRGLLTATAPTCCGSSLAQTDPCPGCKGFLEPLHAAPQLASACCHWQANPLVSRRAHPQHPPCRAPVNGRHATPWTPPTLYVWVDYACAADLTMQPRPQHETRPLVGEPPHLHPLHICMYTHTFAPSLTQAALGMPPPQLTSLAPVPQAPPLPSATMALPPACLSTAPSRQAWGRRTPAGGGCVG